MKEKRKPIKRKGKMPHKKLNMRDMGRRDNINSSSDEKNSFETKKTYKPKITLNQRVSQFRQNGFTLLKGKKDGSKKIIGFKFILCAVAVIVISAIILTVASAPTGIVEYISTKVSLSKSGESFPVSYDFSTGGDITYSNSSVLVTTENELKCYNRTGNLIYTRNHGLAKPIVKTSQIRTLVYGVNDSHYRIETAEKEVLSKKTDNNAAIIYADISDCGVYATVTESDEDIALVTVYSKDGNEIFKYHSANNYVTGVTVSENGKKICVVSLSTNQAEFVSKLSVFDLNSTNPIYETELKGEVVYTAEYVNSTDICVITDKRYFNLNNDKINETLSYNPEFLNKFEISDEYILLFNTADSNSQAGTVYVLSKKGAVKAQFSIDESISDISAYDNRVYTLGEKVNEYNFDGEIVSSSENNNGAVKIAACPSGVAVLYSSGVDFIKE